MSSPSLLIITPGSGHDHHHGDQHYVWGLMYNEHWGHHNTPWGNSSWPGIRHLSSYSSSEYSNELWYFERDGWQGVRVWLCACWHLGQHYTFHLLLTFCNLYHHVFSTLWSTYHRALSCEDTWRKSIKRILPDICIISHEWFRNYLGCCFSLSEHSLDWAQVRSDFSHLAPSPDQFPDLSWPLICRDHPILASHWSELELELKWLTGEESWSAGIWNILNLQLHTFRVFSARGQKSQSSLIEVVKNPLDLRPQPLHFNTGLLLVKTDHVTWILACDWWRQITWPLASF